MGIVTESLQFDTSSAERSVRGFGVSLSAVAEGADHFGSRAGKAAQALGVVSPQAQAAAMAVADLADGLSLVATPAGAVGVGVLAVGASALGAAALVAGLVAGLADLTRSSVEALPALDELAAASGVTLVPDATRDRLQRAAGAMDAFDAASTAAGAALADAFSPALTEAATLGVQLALAVREITIRSADMGMALVDIGIAMLDGFMMPMQGAVASVGALLLVASKAANVLGRDGLASELREAGEAAMSFAGDGAVSGGLERLKISLGGYRDEAEALVGAQVALNKAGQETTRTTSDAAAATDDLAGGVDAAIGRLGDLFDATGNAVEEANAAVDDIIAAVNAVPASVEAAQARIASLKAGAAQGLGIASDIAGGGFGGAMNVVSQAGPVGAVIAAVIQVVKGIEEGMISDIHTQMMSLFQGLPDIADSLAAGVEQSITEGIPALAEGLGGLIANMPDMVWRILEASTVGLAKALADAFKGFFDQLFGGADGSKGGTQRQAQRDMGTSTTGLSQQGTTSRTANLSDRTAAGQRNAGAPPERIEGAFMAALNGSDRRNNLTSASGVRYSVAGPVRAT